MVVGDGTLLVPMWLHGLVQLLMAIVVRIISNSGSMAMVAQILSLMMTCWRTRNTRRPSQTECHKGPATVTAGCVCGRAPWAQNPMRGAAKDGRPETLQTTTGVWASGQVSGSLSGRMFLGHKGSCDALEKRT